MLPPKSSPQARAGVVVASKFSNLEDLRSPQARAGVNVCRICKHFGYIVHPTPWANSQADEIMAALEAEARERQLSSLKQNQVTTNPLVKDLTNGDPNANRTDQAAGGGFS